MPPAEPENTSKTDTAEADARKAKMVKAGVAVGIGSAALVAALLYANRGKYARKPKKD